jgi:transcriptional regulator with XRE-family HTH domain
MKNPPKPSLLKLAKAIRERREELELSQERLAEECGFDRTYISMLERGTRNPSFLNLLKIASGLKTSVSRLTVAYNGTETD